MAPYLITYYLFLWRETSRSFHACACESSDDPRLGSAVVQIGKRERKRKTIQFCSTYFPSKRQFIQHCKYQRITKFKKKISLKNMQIPVSKVTSCFKKANSLGCSFQLPTNICMVISITICQRGYLCYRRI